MQVKADVTERPVPEDTDRASILIVDDLPEKLLVFGTVLEELGQNLVYARSGTEALKEVLKQEFAVILLDVNMPDIDGFETASMIRQYRRSAHTPIIFITAYADEIQTARGYSLGAVDYILSPVVPAILCSKIKVFVDLFLMQRRIRRQADERIALAASEAARRAAEENTRRSNYLARASRQLGDSLDVDVAVRKLLGLIVPEQGDFAAVVMTDGECAAVQHPSQSVQMAWRADQQGAAVMGNMPLTEWSPSLLAACTLVMSNRQVAHLPSDEMAKLEELLASQRLSDEQCPLHQALLLPLVAGERALGVLIVAASTSGDWRVLEDLAGRAAIALDNARLYSTLQAEIVERRSAEFKLQAANQRKDEFLAMLSHELRNPLAPIRNAVEVIRRLAPPDAKLRWANDVVDRQIRHLTRLVEELLDVARISQGKIALHMEPVDLRASIEHGIETTRPYIEQREHALTVQVPTQPVWLRGDFARLSQVVANLLNNAAKYTEMGGTISLSLDVQEDQAVITVADNGIGIEPDLLPHVFDLFEQGRRTLDRSQGGLGVGLTLVQRLIHLHHGTIQAHSKGSGQGSQFSVHLPYSVSANMPDEEPLHLAIEDETPTCKVLIVDDNVDAADSVAMVLNLHGHEVMTVSDGAQAMACIDSFAPEAVVLDIGLPGIDGYDVARRLRRMDLTKHALLIAVTGYGQREDIDRASAAGFDHHFVKPVDPQSLACCIAQAKLKMHPMELVNNL